MNFSLLRRGRILAAALLLVVARLCAQSPNPADHRIMVGDLLDIQVAGEPNLTKVYGVGGDGAVAFPLVGRIAVADKTVTDAARAIQAALDAQYFKNASVTIRIAEFVEGVAYIQGAVAGPRSVETKGDRPVTLLEAIAMCGGLAGDAAGDQVRIYRWMPGSGFQREIIRVNVREMLNSMDMRNDQYLRPRDLVFVPRVGATEGAGDFLALGEVASPGFHPASEKLDLIRAVTIAGGMTQRARMESARLLRPDGRGQYTPIPVNLGRLFEGAEMSQNVPVKAGDILFVPSSTSAGSGQVIFLGAIAKPGTIGLPLDQQTTLARSILNLGGFSKFAKDDKVKVIRTAPGGTKQTVEVDVAYILRTGDFDRDLVLRDGDVVIVPEGGF